jgi:hypothetical protein
MPHNITRICGQDRGNKILKKFSLVNLAMCYMGTTMRIHRRNVIVCYAVYVKNGFLQTYIISINGAERLLTERCSLFICKVNKCMSLSLLLHVLIRPCVSSFLQLQSSMLRLVQL